MEYENIIKRLEEHKLYLEVEQKAGCDYTDLIKALDVAINELQNCDLNKFNLIVDGNSWCAYRDGFINLQESNSGFGDTPDEAIKDLLKEENKLH